MIHVLTLIAQTAPAPRPTPFWSIATLLTIVKVVAGIAAFFAAATAIWRAPLVGRPVKWLGRTLVGDPVSAWAQERVHEAVAEAVDVQSVEIGHQLGLVHRKLDGAAQRIATIEGQVVHNGGTSMKDSLDRLERQLEDHIRNSPRNGPDQ